LLPQFGNDYFDRDILSEIYLILLTRGALATPRGEKRSVQAPTRCFAPQRGLAKSAIGQNLDKFVFRFYRNL